MAGSRLADAFANPKSLLTDWRMFDILRTLILLLETVIGAVIIWKVPYTEIDWRAYMQEVEGWIGGDTDYMNLKGDTGPLVYPAGFMYVYRALRWATDGGVDIRAAQWIFLGVYLATQWLVLDIYSKARPGPPWVTILLCLSKRIHSLYVLRLFNDCVAMLLFYAAMSLMLRHKWLLSSILYSCAVSIKMNVLLFAPAVGLLLLRNAGIRQTLNCLSACAAVQLALGSPFLLTFPKSYFARAFEFSRVFMYKWTVNWKFLPEETFLSKGFATSLLCCHLGLLFLLAWFSWTSWDGGLWSVLNRIWSHANKKAGSGLDGSTTGDDAAPGSGGLKGERTRPRRSGHAADGSAADDDGESKKKDSAVSDPNRPGFFHDSPEYIAYLLFACNYVGMCFSRTMHYQFYTWYFHSLPFLLWRFTDMPVVVRLAILAGIEFGFNVGDADGAGSQLSSGILQACQLLLLAGIALGDAPHPRLGWKLPQTSISGFDPQSYNMPVAGLGSGDFDPDELAKRLRGHGIAAGGASSRPPPASATSASARKTR